jgi:hypothetical protein
MSTQDRPTRPWAPEDQRRGPRKRVPVLFQATVATYAGGSRCVAFALPAQISASTLWTKRS